jgi:hypothetical protein
MLKLDKDLINDEIFKSFNTLEKVRERLETMGIKQPPAPESDLPKVPENLESLSDMELGSFHSRLLEHYNFASSKLAEAEAEKLQITNQVTYLKAKLESEGTKDVKINDAYLYALRLEQEIKQTIIMLESLKTILNKDMTVISRNIEIRKLDWEKNRRDGGIRSTQRAHPDFVTRKRP